MNSVFVCRSCKKISKVLKGFNCGFCGSKDLEIKDMSKSQIKRITIQQGGNLDEIQEEIN
jgi:Zn finger protein HypA/HybF involved in hydrogenase expression